MREAPSGSNLAKSATLTTQHSGYCNLWNVTHLVLKAAFAVSVSDPKVLILDSDTTKVVSVVYSMTSALESGVYLIENIEYLENLHKSDVHYDPDQKSGPRTLGMLSCIMLLRPTTDNYLKLANELRNPLFKSYQIFFSNGIAQAQIERLARWDAQHERVAQLAELYIDYIPVRPYVFTLDIKSVSRLMAHERTWWEPVDDAALHRLIDGLTAAIVASRYGMEGPQARPSIRYCSASSICNTISYALDQRLQQIWNNVIVDSSGGKSMGQGDKVSNGSLILLLDRREDPLTPLLTQWTYQAMTHELLGIENERFKILNPNTKVPEEFTFSPATDSFFKDHCDDNLGELGLVVQQYVKTFQSSSTQSTNTLSSIEEITQFVNTYADKQKLAGNIAKHVAVLHFLTRVVEENNLFESSQIEQDIVTNQKEAEHFKLVSETIRSSKTPSFEKLRLALLVLLAYPSAGQSLQTTRVEDMKKILRTAKMEESQLSFIDAVLNFAHCGFKRPPRLSSGLIAAARTAISRGLKGVQNVYSQHKSLFCQILEQLAKSSLSAKHYPYVTSAAIATCELRDVIVFIMGGITYQEARELSEFQKQHNTFSVILGGTYIHNSKTFLADARQASSLQHTMMSESDNNTQWNTGASMMFGASTATSAMMVNDDSVFDV